MWIFTETGFISAVRKGPNPNEISVRARDRKSLIDLAGAADVGILKSPRGDYPYRIFLNEVVFSQWLFDQAMKVDYDNFKSRVHETRGHVYASDLSRVWSVMLDTEDEDSRNA
jgi:hypothetical protein